MILVYSTPTCAYCKQVKQFLTYKKIQFEERSAFDSPEYQELAQKYGMTVPLIYNTEKDQAMVGYNLPKLTELVS